MKKLKIKGGSALQKELAKEAVSVAEEVFFRKYRALELIVTIRKFNKDDDGAVGWCYPEFYTKSPRHFCIEISKDLKIEQFIKTMFHELTHMRQYAKNELYDCYKRGAFRTIWKNEDFTNTEYTERPWEIEALHFEETLFDLMMKT